MNMKKANTSSPSVFYSHAYPGTSSWSNTYARSLARPLAMCVLPVMIVTLLAVLQGFPVTFFLVWLFPAAFIIAFSWTTFRLKRAPAELSVFRDQAAIRTVWECAFHQPATWDRVLDVRNYDKWIFVTIGLHSYEINQYEWPLFQDIHSALKAARYSS